VPAYSPENEIDMQEGTGGVKRGQAEPEENSHNENGGRGRGSRGDYKMNQPSQPYLHPQVQCQSIIQRTGYICMRGLEE